MDPSPFVARRRSATARSAVALVLVAGLMIDRTGRLVVNLVR